MRQARLENLKVGTMFTYFRDGQALHLRRGRKVKNLVKCTAENGVSYRLLASTLVFFD